MDPNTNLFDDRLSHFIKKSSQLAYSSMEEFTSFSNVASLLSAGSTAQGSPQERVPMIPPTNEQTFYHVQMFLQDPANPDESSWIEVRKTVISENFRKKETRKQF